LTAVKKHPAFNGKDAMNIQELSKEKAVLINSRSVVALHQYLIYIYIQIEAIKPYKLHKLESSF